MRCSGVNYEPARADRGTRGRRHRAPPMASRHQPARQRPPALAAHPTTTPRVNSKQRHGPTQIHSAENGGYCSKRIRHTPLDINPRHLPLRSPRRRRNRHPTDPLRPSRRTNQIHLRTHPRVRTLVRHGRQDDRHPARTPRSSGKHPHPIDRRSPRGRRSPSTHSRPRPTAASRRRRRRPGTPRHEGLGSPVGPGMGGQTRSATRDCRADRRIRRVDWAAPATHQGPIRGASR